MSWSELSLREHVLKDDVRVYSGNLPGDVAPGPDAFEALWNLHPADQPEIRFDDEVVIAPRWHRAYERDYEFAGTVSRAEPCPAILKPMLRWVQESIDERINGILVNWYDAALEHRIAPHKDSPIGRVEGVPIVTISLGAPRTFQMLVRKRRVGIRVGHGSFVLIPDETNRRFPHAVPHLPDDGGRRISVTLRGFEDVGGGKSG